jgi:hypothetical protein
MANKETKTATPDTGMSWFICKRRCLFQRDEIVDDPRHPGDKMQIVHDSFQLNPDPDPRTPVLAPAWIKETDFYKLLAVDGGGPERHVPTPAIREVEVPAQQAGIVRG